MAQESRVTKEEVKGLLKMMHGVSEFGSIPVSWGVNRKGPRMNVQKGNQGVRIEINIKGLGMMDLQNLAVRAMKAANDIAREITSAVIVSSDAREIISRQTSEKFVRPELTREEIEYMLENKRKEVADLENKLEGMEMN